MYGRFTQVYTWQEIHGFLNLLSPPTSLRHKTSQWFGKSDSQRHWNRCVGDSSRSGQGALDWQSSRQCTGGDRDYGVSDRLETCVILTTDTNDALRFLHHRMPVVLEPSEALSWLRCEDVPLDPFPSHNFVTWPVSRRVNSLANGRLTANGSGIDTCSRLDAYG